MDIKPSQMMLGALAALILSGCTATNNGAAPRIKELLRRYFDEWANRGDQRVADQLIATNLVLGRDWRDRYAFLTRHPEAGVCGTWVRLIGERDGKILRYPTDPAEIHCQLLFESPLAHPTVMIRRRLLERAGLSYDNRFRRAQDYDLWVRSVRHFPILNVPEVLMLYRVHSSQAGARALAEQEATAMQVIRAQLDNLGIRPTPEELEIHRRLGTGRILPSRRFIDEVEGWPRKIRSANAQRGVYKGLQGRAGIHGR